MDELRRVDSLVRLSMSRHHFEGVPGNAIPLSVTPVILGLEKGTVNVGTQSTDIVRSDSRVPCRILVLSCSWSEVTRYVLPIRCLDGIPCRVAMRSHIVLSCAANGSLLKLVFVSW